MRIKVTKEQFHLLLANYQIISDKGLAMVMNGSTINKIAENKKSGLENHSRLKNGLFPNIRIVNISKTI
jgi:hypothetical protein